jgi:hypothetical protein
LIYNHKYSPTGLGQRTALAMMRFANWKEFLVMMPAVVDPLNLAKPYVAINGGAVWVEGLPGQANVTGRFERA